MKWKVILMGTFNANKKILTKITAVLLSAAMGVLCAFLVSCQTKSVWSEMSLDSAYLQAQSSEEILSTETSVEETTSDEISSNESVQSESSQPKPQDPTIIESYQPSNAKTLSAGSTLKVAVSARLDCDKVTAKFNGKTITLKKSDDAKGDFADYTGSFTLPEGNESYIDLGGVTFYAKWKEYTKTIVSPHVACLRDEALDSTTVVEVVAESAETFSGSTTNDNSDPRLSYLPKGTIDYKVGKTVYDPKSEKYYYNMRFGRRVYVDKPNPPDEKNMVVSKTYKGNVPDKNEISIASTEVSGHHTYITFDTLWKAPFTVSVAPQKYDNPSKQDFEVSSTTCSYVDIKFCYTDDIGGKLSFPESHPLFLASKVKADDDGYVLRIYLKKVGAFYGWNAYYNKDGQLVFKFLNPTKATTANNKYGIRLKGITIMIDVGHGGKDIGASGLKPNTMPEAERNLLLSNLLKKELEKMGATVVMTRYNDTAVTSEQRCSMLRNTSPDLCISIHHDSASIQSNNGCGVFCFNSFSHKATVSVYKFIEASKIYKKTYKEWHYFYLARESSCPVVLVENGFISNPTDFKGISNYKTNVKKAENMAQAIANYFRTI